jgi:hypothetical protein
MPREALCAVASALVLGVCLAWLLLARPEPIVAPGAGRAGGALAIARLHMPALGGFAQYDVNADNPFVPYHERIRPAGVPAAPAGWSPPHPPPGVPTPVAPPLHLPPAQPGGGDAPRVVGYVRGGNLAAGLHVVLPGRQEARRMLVGERTGRWTLQAIETGSIAVFADETGRNYRQLIAAP